VVSTESHRQNSDVGNSRPETCAQKIGKGPKNTEFPAAETD
jgi:hypothetical protein